MDGPLVSETTPTNEFMPTILEGDVISKMKTLDDQSVDCIITSPPYWGQRDYEHEDQWGNEDEVDLYIDRMCLWMIECKRVLKNEGTMFLNINDKYDKKKSLMMIPEKLCIKMLENGWILRNKIIWYKPNHQPSGVKDRFTNTWEYIYFFGKDSGKYFNYRYYQNIDTLRLETKTKDKPIEGFPETLTVDEYKSQGYEQKLLEYNNKKKYKGKYIDQDKNIGGSAGGRSSKSGLSYLKKRVHTIIPQKKTEIHRYLKHHYVSWKKTKPEKTIDEQMGYKNKSGHWFREDPGGSLPLPGDWFPLKAILKFDDRYDKLMTEEHYVLSSVKNNPKGKNPGDIWEIKLDHSKSNKKSNAENKNDTNHYAAFPEEISNKLIDGFCPPGGTVLDTFAGSGTTGVSAMNKKVKSIMIELNPKFCALMKSRFLPQP